MPNQEDFQSFCANVLGFYGVDECIWRAQYFARFRRVDIMDWHNFITELKVLHVVSSNTSKFQFDLEGLPN